MKNNRLTNRTNRNTLEPFNRLKNGSSHDAQDRFESVTTSFDSENLVVDYIAFKFQYLEDSNLKKLASYLFKIGFNSYQESGKLARPIKEPIFLRDDKKFQVLFVNEAPYWKGTSLHFSGTNAAFFYSLIKQELVSWKLFSSALLSRFDLYYSRNNKTTDKILVSEFLDNCHRKLKQTNKNVSFDKNSKGLILKIGSRRSNHFSRIYQPKNSCKLKFEYEMKGKFIQKYHLLLVGNLLEEFEHKLSADFLLYFGKLLPLEYSYLDWLVFKLRPIRKQPSISEGLNSDYIKSEILMDTRTFVSLLQFLNYAQDLDFKIEFLGSTAFRKVVFKLRDFLEFQDHNLKPTNRYRLGKTKKFFQQLQAGLYVTSFSDGSFQSLVILPKVEFEQCPHEQFLIAKVWVVEELFYYKYPFSLPNFFQEKLTKYQLEVRFKVFQVFTSLSIEKEIFVDQFFKSYPSVLSNQQKTKMKQDFIEVVTLLEEHNLIESKYKVMSNGNLYSTQELTTKNIHEGFVIYEKLSS